MPNDAELSASFQMCHIHVVSIPDTCRLWFSTSVKLAKLHLEMGLVAQTWLPEALCKQLMD